MKLRTVFLFNNFLLGAVSLTAAGALVLVTSFLHQTSDSSARSLEKLRVAEEFKASLLVHNRFSLLQTAYPSIDYTVQLSESETATKKWLNEIHNSIDDDRETALVERVKGSTQIYLNAFSKNDQLKAPKLKDHILAVDELDGAYLAIEELTKLNVQQAQTLHDQIRKFDTTSNIAGVITFFIATIGIFTMLWIFRSKFYLPLLALRKQIARFGKGDFTSRAHSQGVVELKEIATTFNDLADNLSGARKTQLRFLASIAHDLKNPLGAIKMATQILAENSLAESTELKPLTDIIIRQTDHLERLVTDLLDTTRMEAGQIHLKLSLCDLCELTEDAVKLYQSISKIHHLRIVNLTNPLLCECDPTRVSQVLNNMLSNAIKYSPQGGEVLITVATKNGCPLIEVKDHGLGIAFEEQERIFEPFRRTDATRDTIPGIGLGLSFARKIAQAHGGNIEVQSQSNAGSIFTFTLGLIKRTQYFPPTSAPPS